MKYQPHRPDLYKQTPARNRSTWRVWLVLLGAVLLPIAGIAWTWVTVFNVHWRTVGELAIPVAILLVIFLS